MSEMETEVTKKSEEKEQQSISPDPEERADKRKYLLLLLLLLLVAAGIGGWFWWKSRQDNVSKYWFDKAAKDGMIEGRTEEEIQKILDTVVQEGMFNISINPSPVFEDGSSEGNLCIENIKANHYYARVTLTLDDTGEEIFESKGLKPGQYIDNVKLDKHLKKGTYPATAQFIITDPETLEDIGKVNTEVILTIQN